VGAAGEGVDEQRAFLGAEDDGVGMVGVTDEDLDVLGELLDSHDRSCSFRTPMRQLKRLARNGENDSWGHTDDSVRHLCVPQHRTAPTCASTAASSPPSTEPAARVMLLDTYNTR